MPYTTLGGYRRAVRKDELPPNIKKFHYRNRDEQQFNRWTAAIGKKNMPASLADFQELKYNNKDKFELLNAYKTSIEGGRISPLVSFALYDEVKTKIQKEIIGLKTVNNIIITSQSNHFIERVFGSVEQRRSGVDLEIIKKCLLEGNEAKQRTGNSNNLSAKLYITGLAMVTINPATGKLIQVNPYSGGRSEKF